MFHLRETIHDVKKIKDGTINIFGARDLIKSTSRMDEHVQGNINHAWEVLHYIANNAVNRIIGKGQTLDAAQNDSFLDSISGLPNLRAALLKMDQAIHEQSHPIDLFPSCSWTGITSAVTIVSIILLEMK